MVFLNTSKAKNVLTRAKIDTASIVKGEAAEIDISAEDIIKEIIKSSICKKFQALDTAGIYLKESHLTRSTSHTHKKYDFSSLQSDSSLELQKLYQNILENKCENIFDADGKSSVTLDKKTKAEVERLGKSLTKSLNNAIAVIRRNPALTDMLKEDLEDINSNSAILQKLGGYMPDNLDFSKDAKIKARRNFKGKFLDGAILASHGTGTIVQTGALILQAAALVGSASAGLTAATIAAAGGALVIGVPILAGFLIAVCVVDGNKERFGTIAAKKEMIKINDEFKNAIKYLNKAAYLVQKNTVKSDAKEQKIQVYKEQRNIFKQFLEHQASLWKPFTKAELRGYAKKSEEDENETTHKSGLRTVSNEKTSTLGKMKQGIARTWFELCTEIKF